MRSRKYGWRCYSWKRASTRKGCVCVRVCVWVQSVSTCLRVCDAISRGATHFCRLGVTLTGLPLSLSSSAPLARLEFILVDICRLSVSFTRRNMQCYLSRPPTAYTDIRTHSQTQPKLRSRNSVTLGAYHWGSIIPYNLLIIFLPSFWYYPYLQRLYRLMFQFLNMFLIWKVHSVIAIVSKRSVDVILSLNYVLFIYNAVI